MSRFAEGQIVFCTATPDECWESTGIDPEHVSHKPVKFSHYAGNSVGYVFDSMDERLRKNNSRYLKKIEAWPVPIKFLREATKEEKKQWEESVS